MTMQKNLKEIQQPEKLHRMPYVHYMTYICNILYIYRESYTCDTQFNPLKIL